MCYKIYVFPIFINLLLFVHIIYQCIITMFIYNITCSNYFILLLFLIFETFFYMQWNTQIMSECLLWWPLSCWWDLTIVYITPDSSFTILSNQFPPATLRGSYFLTFVIMNYFCLLIQVNGIIPYLFLHLAFFIQHSGFRDSSRYPRCCINVLFLFVTEQYTILWIDPQSLIYSLIFKFDHEFM